MKRPAKCSFLVCFFSKKNQDLLGEFDTPISSVLAIGVLFYYYLFNRALFLQCSHVTSMQSPYVLNMNEVDLFSKDYTPDK